jgi:hypothetical protein
MLSYLRTLQTFLYTLLLPPAVALAQVTDAERDIGYQQRGWGWLWLLIIVAVVLAFVGWAATRRRGRRGVAP